MDIDTMAAGREMDRLIALLMGLSVVDEEWVITKDAPDIWKALPAYSTDIAAAWQVLEQLNALPHSFVCVLSRPHANNLPSVMLFWCGARPWPPEDVFLHLAEEEAWSRHPWNEGTHPVIRVSAKTMPLAICRAALKATGYPG